MRVTSERLLESLENLLADFRSYGDIPGVFEAQAPLIRAIILAIRGDKETARRLLVASMTASVNSRFAGTVSTIASRLQIAVN